MCCTLKPIFIVWKVPGVNFYYLLSTRGAHSCSRKCPARPATGFRASSKPLMTYSRATCKIKLPEAPENRHGFKCRAATYLVHSVVLIRGITGSAPTCCTPHTVLPVSPSAAQICHTVEVVESASAKKANKTCNISAVARRSGGATVFFYIHPKGDGIAIYRLCRCNKILVSCFIPDCYFRVLTGASCRYKTGVRARRELVPNPQQQKQILESPRNCHKSMKTKDALGIRKLHIVGRSIKCFATLLLFLAKRMPSNCGMQRCWSHGHRF